jgi:2-dehydropantoate 2-reductase
MSMKITVVGGAGAMGGVWASRLSAAGNDVAILDVSKDALAAIAMDGLIVDQPDGSTKCFHIKATEHPEQIGVSELLIFFTKAHHTASAANLAKPLVNSSTTVLSLQNGWGNSDTLAKTFPAEQIVMGVTYHSAKVVGPGHIAHTADAGPTFIGPYQDGAPMDRAQQAGDAMTSAGIATTVTLDVKTEVWKKLVLNCATLPVTSLTRLTTGALGADEQALLVCDVLAIEATAVANALGYQIDPKERTTTIRALVAKGGAGKASMLQDVEAQRKTEIEVVNGAVVREAERLGIDVPVNRAMVNLIGGLERSWRQ